MVLLVTEQFQLLYTVNLIRLFYRKVLPLLFSHTFSSDAVTNPSWCATYFISRKGSDTRPRWNGCMSVVTVDVFLGTSVVNIPLIN